VVGTLTSSTEQTRPGALHALFTAAISVPWSGSTKTVQLSLSPFVGVYGVPQPADRMTFSDSTSALSDICVARLTHN
jgi:hypothetical protein